MKLIWKFNLVLLGIFLLGFVIAGYLSYRALQTNAREEILQILSITSCGTMKSSLVGSAMNALTRLSA